MIASNSSDHLAMQERVSQFFAALKSVREFDKHKIGSVLGNLIKPTDRENCFLANYYRAAGVGGNA